MSAARKETSSIVEICDKIEEEFHALWDIYEGKVEVGIPTRFRPA